MAYHRYIFTAPEKEALSSERLDIRLLYISKSRYDRNWQSILHSHAFAELFYVIHGTGVFQTENDSFPVVEDDLVLINPNVTHTEFSHGENALEYIVLGLDGISFRSANNTFLPYTICNLRSNRKEMLFYTQTLTQELREKKENYINICQNLLEILIQLVDRNTIAIPDFSTTDKLSRECHFIEQYLDEHFAEEINLDTLSELTYMNKYYMVHAFTRYKGVSPISYLINRRIDEAKELLTHSNLPIAKIAQSVGFSSQSYFSQVFRKEVHTTPGAYRKTNGDGEKLLLKALEYYENYSGRKQNIPLDKISVLGKLLELYNRTNRLECSEQMLFRMLEIYKMLAQTNWLIFSEDVSVMEWRLGNLYFDMKRPVQAEQMYLAALKTRAEFDREDI